MACFLLWRHHSHVPRSSFQNPTTEPPSTTLPNISTFPSFVASTKALQTWFRCVSICPRGKFTVRETNCRPCDQNHCFGGRQCYVVDVHNVCVQTCQPGFVMHVGLMECLCPGPVVNQTCTQPVHPVYAERFDSADDTMMTNLSIALPVAICFLAICAMATYVYWKNSSNEDVAKKSCFPSYIAIISCSLRKCCARPREKQLGIAINGAMRRHSSLQEIRCPSQQDDVRNFNFHPISLC